jgi:hypothetical protein
MVYRPQNKYLNEKRLTKFSQWLNYFIQQKNTTYEINVKIYMWILPELAKKIIIIQDAYFYETC